MLKRQMKDLKRIWEPPASGNKAAIGFALHMNLVGEHPTAYTLYWLFSEEDIIAFTTTQPGKWLVKRIPQDRTMSDEV